MPTKEITEGNNIFNLLNLDFSDGIPTLKKFKNQFSGLGGHEEEEKRKEIGFNDNFVWRVVDQNEEVKLEPGTIFRMGKLRFRVREIFDGEQNKKIEIEPKMKTEEEVIKKINNIFLRNLFLKINIVGMIQIVA